MKLIEDAAGEGCAYCYMPAIYPSASDATPRETDTNGYHPQVSFEKTSPYASSAIVRSRSSHAVVFGGNSSEEASSEEGSFWAGQGVDIELTSFMSFLDLFGDTLTRGELRLFLALIIRNVA